MDNKAAIPVASGPFTAAQEGTSQQGITPSRRQCLEAPQFSVRKVACHRGHCVGTGPGKQVLFQGQTRALRWRERHDAQAE